MGTLTNDVNASRLKMVRKFSKTTIPINIFRSKPNRVFLQAVQKLSSVPDYKTVESDMKKMETYCLSVLKGTYHYGVQLDHWKGNKGNNILVILVSFLTENYQPVVQVIDFKKVESGRAITTSRELEKTLRVLLFSKQQDIASFCSRRILSVGQIVVQRFRKLDGMDTFVK